MKKLILIASVLLGTFGAVKAQSSAKVKVNVVLNPFQSIEIGKGESNGQVVNLDEVTLEYKNAADYKNGVEKVIPNQLKVSSVGSGFRIKAEMRYNGVATSNLTRVAGNGETTVNANDLLAITVGNSAKMDASTNMDFGPVGSSSDAQASVLDKELDVKYSGKSLNEAMVKKLLGNGGKDTAAKYTVDVVYTIAAN
ncbi:hypothetical protein [Sphingobacterium multivorum]|uniref:hypothetical protein n=1 Tax=Sphingobacterium multivorum TaxID=28454 RepID=UPI003015E983